ncbi:MAG: hypothetical protein KAG61_13165 [Bacteriovoracaceae bacterium]|nr:hypothetical protein [Bacteriovoracaceae bacterium]
MKKQLLLLALLLVNSTSYATKARLESLGQDGNRGSFYIDDTRSVFLNPAYLNMEKNLIITEWGSGNNNADSATAPHAEGGIFADSGSFTLGAYFGSELGAHNEMKNDKFQKQDNRVDLFFAGDAGLLWGIKVYYADGVSEPVDIKKTNTAYGINLGFILGSFEVFGDIGLKDTSEGADASSDKFDSDLAIKTGITYKVKGNSFHFEYDKSSFKQDVAASSEDGSATRYKLGFGRIYPVNKTARIFSDLSVNLFNEKYDAHEDLEGVSIPLNIAFETDLNSWLMARGSVKHSVYSRIKREGKLETDPNSTVVAAGIRAHSGQFNLDGIIGQDSSGDKTGTFGTVSRLAIEYLF